MKHIVVSIITLCLCIAFCDAQTIRIEIPIDSLQKQDSIANFNWDSVDYVLQLERLFKRRTNERIWQLTEIISFLCDKEKDEQLKKHYSKMAMKLFADNTKVIARRNNIYFKEMRVDKFLKRISADHKISFVTLDSIEIPKWDYALIQSDTLGVVYAESEMTSIHPARHYSGTHRRLPIVNNETEDGIEWVPLFGKMIVTINYKDGYERNSNWSNLDAISSKLR